VNERQAAAAARRLLGAGLALQPLKASDAVTFRSPLGIVRVTPLALRPLDDLDAEAHTARTLADAGAPVPRPLQGPQVVEDAAVAVWEDVPDAGVRGAAAYAAMGRALRRFHEVGGTLLLAGQLQPRPWQPLAWLSTRIARGGSAVDALLAAEVVARATAEAGRLTGSETLLHTDAHAANFRVDADGRAVLVDLEGLARGPWPYDLAPMAVGERRYGGDPALFAAAAVAYGVAPDDGALEPAIRLRELLAIGYVLGQAHRDPAATDVARARFADLTEGRESAWIVR
jgi:Ser/Thr protein kinase RdoA (MazF antagonist)